MADDKKKDAKKDGKGAPKKDAKPAEGGGGGDPLAFILGVTFALVVLAYVLSGRTLFSGDQVPSWGELLSNAKGDGAASDAPAIGRDEKIVNVEAATVRVDLTRAAVAGEQAKRAKGVVVRGPEEAFNRAWYFVDYEEAPDGWVEAPMITADVGSYTALHIVPIAFDFLRPLAIGLALAIGLFLVLIWWKAAAQEQIAARRAAEEYRAYLRRTGRDLAPAAPEPAALGGAGEAAPMNLPGADLALPPEWGAPSPKGERENERWAHVRALVGSATTSDWRQAIIEADIMLEEMLRAIGYDGVTIGDMLKNVDPADFLTLEKAWEAHKVRNQIAHRGMDFRVERNEAERTIKLFEDVFREFNYI